MFPSLILVCVSVLTDRNCFDDDIKPVSCVSISKKGFITSGPNQCQATVLVTSVERFGVNQTLALHVLVSLEAVTAD